MISDRIAVLKMTLDKKINLSIIQCYAPTSVATDGEKNHFYSVLQNTLENEAELYTIIMGDFNAKVGANKVGEASVGTHGLGERNLRGTD